MRAITRAVEVDALRPNMMRSMMPGTTSIARPMTMRPRAMTSTLVR